MHYTLSWRDDEIKGLTQQQMQRAAIDSLKVLGKDTTKGKRVPKNGGRRQFADQHQYVIVAHTDKKHPHVHILVNLTHPEHGVRLPSSNDFNKLSTWALKYQKEHGNEHLCPKRAENKKARRWSKSKGKFTRFVKAEKRLNRKDYDRQKAIQESQTKTALQEKLDRTETQLKTIAHDQKKRHANELDILNPALEKKQGAIREKAIQAFRKRKQTIVIEARLGLKKLLNEFEADRAEYKQREENIIGRMQNTWAAIKHKGWKMLNSEGERSQFSAAFREIYQLHADPTARFRPIQAKHDQKEAEFNRQVDAKITEAQAKINADRNGQLHDARQKYQKERDQLSFLHRGEAAKLRAVWEAFREKSKSSWQKLVLTYSKEPEQQQEVIAKTNPENLLPREGSTKAAKQIDQHLEGIAERLKQKRYRDVTGVEKDNGDREQ